MSLKGTNEVASTKEGAPKVRLGSVVAMIIIVIGAVGLDQATKYHSQETLMIWTDDSDPTRYQGQRYPIYQVGSPSSDGFYFALSTNYVRNLGAAWGALSGLPDAIRVPFFYVVTLLAVIIIGIYMRSTPPGHRLARYSLTLILSGAIGNFIDRLQHGYVIDWIDVRWNVLGFRYNFPNFNVADCAITVGVGLLMWDMLVLESARRRQEGPTETVNQPATS